MGKKSVASFTLYRSDFTSTQSMKIIYPICNITLTKALRLTFETDAKSVLEKSVQM